MKIRCVENNRDLCSFIDFPHKLYSNDTNYVPELYVSQKDLLNREKHPFFKHSEAEFYLAEDERGDVAGRIAAIHNRNYIDFTGENTGFFGFFDVIDDYSVAKELLDTALNWLRDRELEKVIGPENYSTNETCGMLVEGFDMPPVIMMPYNKEYYPKYLEQYGFSKKIDLLAYRFTPEERPEKLAKIGKLIDQRLESRGITIRSLDMKKFDREIPEIFRVYNNAWEKNWGFVPMTEEEFWHTAKDLKQIADPDFVMIAEKDGQTIGYSLSIPDFNQVLKKIKRGRLFPWGLFKLLYYKNRIDSVRVITLGVLEPFRKLGIEASFYARNFKVGKRKGIRYGEASWILENNPMMIKGIENINGKLYKRYRLYKMDL